MPEVLSPQRRSLAGRRALIVAGVAAVLYTLGGCAKSPGDLKSLARGEMGKLTVTDNPAPAPTTTFHDAVGAPHTLADFRGKVTIVNIWANWCAPCKAEIPSLAKLATAYAGKAVAVVPISVGKDDDEKNGRVFIDRNPPLPFYTEPTYAVAFAFKPSVEGMPTTVILDRKGIERARLVGGADWSGPDARAVVDSLLAEK
jgi:thiol-disulfide isomerase/thioredoxin